MYDYRKSWGDESMKIFKKSVHYDVFVGGLLLLLGVTLFVLAIDMPTVPRRFPILVASFISVIAITILISGIRNSRNPETVNEKAIDWGTAKYPLGFFGILTVYVILIQFIGFFVATSLFLPATMYFMGVRSWKKIVISILCTNAFVWMLFVWQLKIQLP